MFNLWNTNAFASTEFFCSKNCFDVGDSSVGMLSEFLVDAVRTSVWKVALQRFSKDVLFYFPVADCVMMLLATICSRDSFMLLKMEGSVAGVFVA